MSDVSTHPNPSIKLRIYILLVFIIALLLSLIAIFGFMIGRSYENRIHNDGKPDIIVTDCQDTPTPKQNLIDISEITQLITVIDYTDGANHLKVNKIGIRQTPTSNELFMSDEDISYASFKVIHSIPAPGATEFGEVKVIYDYIITEYQGADASDMVIATKSGAIITTSVWELNPNFTTRWVFGDVKWVEKNIASVDLFQIDGTEAYIELDLSTGRFIDNSFKLLN